MKGFITTLGTLVRLDPGEEVLTTLTAFLVREKIQGAVISGIGAVKDVTLGYFDLHRQEYEKTHFAEDMELVSFQGNVTFVHGAETPLIHAHATLSGRDFIAKSGHLFAATIAVTGEFMVQPFNRRIRRALDPRTGLNLIDDSEG